MTQIENVMRDKLQEQVEIALNVARVAYWEYDVADEAFIFNDAAYNILRTSLDEEGSYTIPAVEYMARFIHPDDAGILANEIRRAFKSIDPDFTSDQECRTIWGDGQSGYLNILFKTERDEDGRVTRLFGTGQDITERRQNENILVKRATETEALLNLTRVASSSLDLDVVLEEALLQALTITGFDAGLISMVNPETQSLELRAHRLPDVIIHALQEHGFDGSLCELVYKRQESIVLTDLSQNMPVEATGLRSLGFQSYQGVPIVAKGEIMGTVCLFGHDRLTKEEADIDLLQAIGQQLGFAIRNAALFEQTQSSEARYRTLFDSAADAIDILDKMGNIIDCNETYLQTLGYRRDEVVGQHVTQFFAPESVKFFKEFFPQLKEKGSSEGELIMTRSDGSVIHIWRKAQAICDADGQIVSIVAYNRDITERKNAEAALMEAQARSQFVLESVTLPLLISRVKDGTVLYANNRIAEMMGVPPEDVIGKQTPDFYRNPEDRDDVVQAIQKHGGIDNKELALIRADGKSLWAILSNRLIDYENGPAIITTLVDITARKNAEEALARRATELEMVSRVSASAASILETDKLLQEVVDLTKERFNLYHTHIYLLNTNGDTLALTAGAGEVGRQMVAEGRRIALSQEQSLVAQAARTGQGVTENDVRENPAFLPHPLLPNTRSEMAAPMIVGGRVIGVLDTQSEEVGRFTEQDVLISTTLATQIAVALENARSFEQAQKAVTNLNEITRRLTREGWQEYLSDLPSEMTGFIYDPAQINPMSQLTDAAQEARAVTTAVNGANAFSPLMQAITIHGETIGELTVEPDEADEQEMTELITAVAEQLGARIENLRLADQTQMALSEAERQGEELALINRVVTKVAGSLKLQESLEIVAAELAQAISVEQVAITLLNEARTEATVVAEYFGESDYEKALGVVFTLADNPLTQQVVDSRQPVIVTDAQNNTLTAPIHEVMRARGTQTLIILPMTAGNEVIGTVGIDILDGKRKLHEAELRLAETLIFQAATAVQNARLFDQTEAALAETEALYQVSSELNEAGDYDAVTRILRQHTLAADCHIVSLSLFDRPYTETQTPEWIEIASDWSAEPIPQERTLRHKFADYTWPQANQMIKQPEMIVTQDIAASSDLDEKLKDSYLKSNTHSALVLPLVVGAQWIGNINMLFPQKVNLTASDKNLLTALGRQAAVVVQSIGLLSATRKRAQREHQLREIAEKVRGSADVETILRTAVAEVGRALGRRTYISLEENAADTDSIA